MVENGVLLMNELLNCPFCGGEAYVHEHYSFPGYERKGLYPNYEPIGYAVGCVTTDCRGKRENTGFMYSTEDEAIAAWNTRATHSALTAEQVREAVMSADRWEKPMGNTGMTNTHLIVRDDGWQAITDELNAELGSGTCEWVLEHSGTLYDKWRCSKCAYLFVEPRTDQGYTDLEPNFCPNCGRKVVS